MTQYSSFESFSSRDAVCYTAEGKGSAQIATDLLNMAGKNCDKIIIIADQSLARNRAQLVKICMLLMDKKSTTRCRWWCRSRIEEIDNELLWWMKQAGLEGIDLAVDINRLSSLSDIEINSLDTLLDYNLAVRIVFHLELPLRNQREVIDAFEFLFKMKPVSASVEFVGELQVGQSDVERDLVDSLRLGCELLEDENDHYLLAVKNAYCNALCRLYGTSSAVIHSRYRFDRNTTHEAIKYGLYDCSFCPYIEYIPEQITAKIIDTVSVLAHSIKSLTGKSRPKIAILGVDSLICLLLPLLQGFGIDILAVVDLLNNSSDVLLKCNIPSLCVQEIQGLDHDLLITISGNSRYNRKPTVKIDDLFLMSGVTWEPLKL